MTKRDIAIDIFCARGRAPDRAEVARMVRLYTEAELTSELEAIFAARPGNIERRAREQRAERHARGY